MYQPADPLVSTSPSLPLSERAYRLLSASRRHVVTSTWPLGHWRWCRRASRRRERHRSPSGVNSSSQKSKRTSAVRVAPRFRTHCGQETERSRCTWEPVSLRDESRVDNLSSRKSCPPRAMAVIVACCPRRRHLGKHPVRLCIWAVQACSGSRTQIASGSRGHVLRRGVLGKCPLGDLRRSEAPLHIRRIPLHQHTAIA